jgi:hypothetical protein
VKSAVQGVIFHKASVRAGVVVEVATVQLIQFAEVTETEVTVPNQTSAGMFCPKNFIFTKSKLIKDFYFNLYKWR